MPTRIIALVNTAGRQAASVARVAAAVGYQVRAQVNSKDGPVARELQNLENVTVIEGSLTDARLVAELFAGAQKAFINTIPWGDEIAIGKSLADAAKTAGVQHYIYSSMPDHGIYGKGWPSLPLWSVKFTVENYIRQASLVAQRYCESEAHLGTDWPASYLRLHGYLQQQLHQPAISPLLHEAATR